MFSTLAFTLLFDDILNKQGRQTAILTVALLALFPGSLFFNFAYSESLFLLLLVLLWRALTAGSWKAAILPALLLPLARAIGVFAILPICCHLAYAVIWTKAPGTSARIRADVTLPMVLLVLAPIVGWGCYLALMYASTGSAFEGFHAQKNWAVHSVSNLWNVPRFVQQWLTPSCLHCFSGSVVDRMVFTAGLFAAFRIWKSDPKLLSWFYWLGILPAMSGGFTSYTRFASCNLVMFLAVAVELSRESAKTARNAVLSLFFLLHTYLLWRFIHFEWAG